MISVAPLDGSLSVWDAFAAAVPGSTFCHLSGWRAVMEDVLGHERFYAIACDDAGAWRGVLPLVRVRSALFGAYLVSLPFLNSGGPVGTPDAVATLVEHAATLARHFRVDLLELRTRDPVESGLRLSQRKLTVRLELPPAAEDLWRAFDPKLRSQIRRPQRDWHDVFARNMRSLGTPVLPRAFFTRLAAIFAGLIVFGAVYRSGQPVAAGCGFVWRDEFEMTWASSLREHSRSAPNMLLYWSFIEQMIARGVRVFDFGRCTPGSGTHRFKQQWGGADVALPWLQWSPRNVAATPSPERPTYRLAAAVWRRLPLGVTNRIGPFLARRLP